MDHPEVSREKELEKISADKVVPEEKSREVDRLRHGIHYDNKCDDEEKRIGTILRDTPKG